MSTRKRTHSYRGRKDSALALYYLWRVGEVMTHHRENFERVYALTETVAPPHLIYEASEVEADRFMLKKEIAFAGLHRVVRTQDAFHRGASVNLDGGKPLKEVMLEEGEIIEVLVEGWKPLYHALGSDAALLENLAAGRIPEAWKPLDATTADEAVFLSPLDPVSARGRAKALFGFDYTWEVYKPAHQRKYGYYTLPVLWGERLVARFDSKLDRATNTFILLGLWLEDTLPGGAAALAQDEAFAAALARGFARFTTFLGAKKMIAEAVQEPLLRKRIEEAVAG